MSQTRLQSAVEAAANVAIGNVVSFGANMTILPAFGYPVTVRDALGLAIIFTVISIARSFCVRRLFNRWHT